MKKVYTLRLRHGFYGHDEGLPLCACALAFAAGRSLPYKIRLHLRRRKPEDVRAWTRAERVGRYEQRVLIKGKSFYVVQTARDAVPTLPNVFWFRIEDVE